MKCCYCNKQIKEADKYIFTKSAPENISAHKKCVDNYLKKEWSSLWKIINNL